MLDWKLCLGIIAPAACLAWAVTSRIRNWAERLHIVDVPNHRSSHERPVPRGGGASIALICLVGWGLLWWRQPADVAPMMASYLLGALLIIIVSAIDDVRPLSSATRLLAHIAAAVVLTIGCGDWREIALPWVGNVPLLWLGLPLALVWIIGITNAYNFMDGIDGIAATQAIVAGAGWFLLLRNDGPWSLAALALLVAASSAGFLIHNWAPARIFMGDVGSAFLGYTFAFLTLWAGRENPRMCVAGVLLAWPFVCDATFTFLRRLVNRENVFSAHRSHLYQRLVISGWSHAATTLLYTALDLTGLLMALLFVNYPGIGDVAAGRSTGAPMAKARPQHIRRNLTSRCDYRMLTK
jgi:UDP-N-acetylmuramyl pentapeptide phosphotransferase/UDP-N-acetylglucosamine-1-phosphate transferase